MKRNTWTKLAGINLLFIIVIILPFLPGPPNRLVIALSVLGQSAGFFGLLLVPIAIAWIVMEIRNFRKRNVERFNWRGTYTLAIIAMIIITATYLLLTIGFFAEGGLFAGLSGIAVAALALTVVIKKIKKLKGAAPRQFNSAPLYLLTIPLVTFITRIYFVGPVSDYSRHFAIQRSQVLIASIEDYKKREGQYPQSIKDLEDDYLKKTPSPFIMGILNFRYNKINDHYSISFSQWLDLGSLEEIVLYDKNNLHSMINKFSHYDYSLDLHRVNGAFASRNTGYENWRYYLCD